jgi:hypothetical protein
LRRLELDFDFDFEPDGSPPSEPLDELLDRLELLRPGELLEAVRRVPLDELAALERLELRDPLLPPLPLPLLRLLLRLLCDSRCLLSDSPCSLTSPSSIVPRHSPSGSGFIIA